MNPTQQEERQSRTQWDKASLTRLVQSRPAPTLLVFAPGSTFETGALGALAQATGLRMLSLRDTRLSRENLQEIGQLTGLSRLDSKGSRFATADFDALCQMLTDHAPKLTELWLENIALTDDALAAMGTLAQLDGLHLSGTPLNDAGLAHLLPCKSWKHSGWTVPASPMPAS